MAHIGEHIGSTDYLGGKQQPQSPDSRLLFVGADDPRVLPSHFLFSLRSDCYGHVLRTDGWFWLELFLVMVPVCLWISIRYPAMVFGFCCRSDTL